MDFLKNLGIFTAEETGKVVDNEMDRILDEVLNATGTNWTAEKVPMYYPGSTGEMLAHPGKFTVRRSDNDAPIGDVGKDYTILQNREAVQMIYEAGGELFNEGAKFRHPWNNARTLGSFGNIGGGSLLDGSAVFYQIELPEAYIGKSGVKRYITVGDHKNGAKALGFGNGNQVICCKNTFAMAMRELSKIRHTASMAERIEEAIAALRRMLELEEQQINLFEKAAKIPFKNSHIEQVINALFGKEKVQDPDASTKLKNQVIAFGQDLETSIGEQGSTLWAVFNGVTRYTNHTRTAKNKDYSLLFGGDAALNQKAYDLLETWV